METSGNRPRIVLLAAAVVALVVGVGAGVQVVMLDVGATSAAGSPGPADLLIVPAEPSFPSVTPTRSITPERSVSPTRASRKRTATPTATRRTSTPTTSTSTTRRATTTTSAGSTVAATVVSLTNDERRKRGCRSLKVNTKLTKAAQGHSVDMAKNDYFSHDSLDGSSPFDRIRDAGYDFSAAAENIAAGQKTAAAVVRAWMNSSGHRANILNCDFTEIGVGYAKGGSYGTYWTQDFGRPA